MKAITIGILVVVMTGVAVNYFGTETVTYVKEGVTMEVQEVQPEEIVQEDVITKAKEDLGRINAELDAKEQELLEQRKAIDVELERLRETRVSFQ